MNDVTKVVEQQPVDESLVFEPSYDALKHIDQIQRVGQWDQDTYKAALESALEVRAYSRWIIGMLVTEIQEQWPHITYEVLAHDLRETHQCSPNMLRSYATTYKKFSSQTPGYIPPSYIPWTTLKMAGDNPIEGKTPAEVVGELEDEGATNPKSAYKKIKEQQTGISLPPKPNFSTNVVGEGDQTHFKVTVSKNTTRESLELVDWEDFFKQLLDIWEDVPLPKR